MLTMLAERRLAREEPLLAELPVETTERGDMQEVRPLRELRPLSLLLWLWLTASPPPASFSPAAPPGPPPARGGRQPSAEPPVSLRLSMLVFHH